MNSTEVASKISIVKFMTEVLERHVRLPLEKEKLVRLGIKKLEEEIVNSVVDVAQNELQASSKMVVGNYDAVPASASDKASEGNKRTRPSLSELASNKKKTK